MTSRRDFKRLVRERQERTGESYVTARRAVLAQGSQGDAQPVIPVVEMISVTDDAQRLGLKCRALISSTLAQRVTPVVALERVRDALRATVDDSDLDVMRAAVLRGELPELERRHLPAWRAEAHRFVTRALAGIGGVSANGTMLALPVTGNHGPILMVVHLGLRPIAFPQSAPREPRLVLTTVDSFTSGPDRFVLALMT